MTDILRYKGDQTAFDPDWMIGPDFGRRYLAPKSATYDPETDTTTMVLRGILPDEFRERVMANVEEEKVRERIRRLFGAP